MHSSHWLWAPWTSPPPHHLPHCPAPPCIIKVLSIPRGEYDIIQGIVQCLMAYNSQTLPRLAWTIWQLQGWLPYVCVLYMYCINLLILVTSPIVHVWGKSASWPLGPAFPLPPSLPSPHFNACTLKVSMIYSRHHSVSNSLQLKGLAQAWLNCITTPGPTPPCMCILHAICWCL